MYTPKEFYLDKINSLDIAQEIIEGLQNPTYQRRFKTLLKAANQNQSDWEILKERLAGYLSTLSIGT